MHYVWLYEGPQWKQRALAAAVVAGIFAVVLFPLWPMVMRQGVWYLSVGMMGLLGLFFAMSIFRLILFCVTVFTVAPGLWLFPNLFEDVGFFDSFKPLWGWQEVCIPHLSQWRMTRMKLHQLTMSPEQEEKEQEGQVRRRFSAGTYPLSQQHIRRTDIVIDACEARSYRACRGGRGVNPRRSRIGIQRISKLSGIIFFERAKTVLFYLFFPFLFYFSIFTFTFTFDSRHGHGMACGVFFMRLIPAFFFKINILFSAFFHSWDW